MLTKLTKVTKCIREKMTLFTFVGEPLNHIHQDTKVKSARLIAVCKRSFNIDFTVHIGCIASVQTFLDGLFTLFINILPHARDRHLFS